MERWEKISGHTPYEVSTSGRVRNGKRILTPRLYGVGYFGVRLHGKELYIHRAVASAFIGRIPDGFHVNHLDKNRLNNFLDNLEICTPWENCAHARQPIWYKTQKRIPTFK